MNEVEDYIFGFEGDDHEIMKFLHDLMMDQPGIHFNTVDDIPESLYEVIQEAILLDETVPYSSPYFKNREK